VRRGAADDDDHEVVIDNRFFDHAVELDVDEHFVEHFDIEHFDFDDYEYDVDDDSRSGFDDHRVHEHLDEHEYVVDEPDDADDRRDQGLDRRQRVHDDDNRRSRKPVRAAVHRGSGLTAHVVGRVVAGGGRTAGPPRRPSRFANVTLVESQRSSVCGRIV
jgi:hypothetical protein